ncbi:dihydrodipicolinate synthase family protein [Leucobacter sp. Z1108]|uniref:dihydrodipicolinate synthase family protein n=1 Tax=Leucobacter sp. Z1108 TaxID=3439066 RepID=UPI003F3A7184
MFSGMSAFPLTPLFDDAVDERAFTGLVQRLAVARVDSITALGSTGAAAYLTLEERARVAALAVEHSQGVPVIVGVSALRTSHVLANVRAAERAGAQGLLLAPMSYQPLADGDVFELFRSVLGATDLPVILYDNPTTTHFTFTDQLYARIAKLPGLGSIKIPGVPQDPDEALARVQQIRALVPKHVTIGVSGDAVAADGLLAGCDSWYSVVGGTLPELAMQITQLSLSGSTGDAHAESERLRPLWDLFAECGGSLRVVAAIAEHLGLVAPRCLPLPIQGLSDAQRIRVAEVVAALNLR